MKRQSKKFLTWSFAVLGAAFCFIALNIFVWFQGNQWVFWHYPFCGDLARIGFVPKIAHCKEEVRNLPHKATDWFPDTPVPLTVLTFGDSHSRGMGGGQNNYYQDHVATQKKTTVSWVPELRGDNPIEQLAVLHNSGFLKKYGVKHLILQSSERAVITKFKQDVDFSKTEKLSVLEDYLHYEILRRNEVTAFQKGAWELHKQLEQDPSWQTRFRLWLTRLSYVAIGTETITQIDRFFEGFGPWKRDPNLLFSALNFVSRIEPYTKKYEGHALTLFGSQAESYPLSNILNVHFKVAARYLIGDLVSDKTATLSLERPAFSGKRGTELYLHRGEIENLEIAIVRPEWLKEAHRNLNRLADRLAIDGIVLHFLPVPAKYTAYENWLANPHLPHSPFFKAFESLSEKRYRFVNALPILRQEIDAGVLNVYFQEDTHWSAHALPRVARLFDLSSPSVKVNPMNSTSLH